MESDPKSTAYRNLGEGLLPKELWVEIFPHLTVNAIKTCLRTCKAFQHLYLTLLSAKRNHFIVGRVVRYGEIPFDYNGN